MIINKENKEAFKKANFIAKLLTLVTVAWIIPIVIIYFIMYYCLLVPINYFLRLSRK